MSVKQLEEKGKLRKKVVFLANNLLYKKVGVIIRPGQNIRNLKTKSLIETD